MPNSNTKHIGTQPRGFFAGLAGVDSDILSATGRGDRIAANRTALAFVLSFMFVTSSVAVGLGIAMPGLALPLRVGFGMLCAASIMLLDHAIVQALWHESGEQALAPRLDFPIRNKRSSITFCLLWGSRILLSLCLAFTLASFLELQIYAGDIRQQLARNHAAANEQVMVRARASAEAEIKVVEAEVERLKNSISTETQLALGQHNAAMAKFERQQAALEAEQDDLMKRLKVAEADLMRARDDASAEKWGVATDPRHSGKKGEGPRFRHAQQIADLREAEIAKIKMRLAEIGKALAAIDVPRDSKMPSGLPEMNTRFSELAQRLTKMRQDLPERIKAIAEADQLFIPMEDGLLIRMHALTDIISSGGLALWLSIALLPCMMALETAGLLAKLFYGHYSMYAQRLAAQMLAEQDQLVVDITHRRQLADQTIATSRRDRHRAEREEHTAKIFARELEGLHQPVPVTAKQTCLM